jgi:hypothetical protein
MRRTLLKPDLLEPDEFAQGTSCPDWSVPRHEVRPVGFSAPDQHEGVFDAPAGTAQHLAQLADEIARMRAQLSQVLAQVKQRLALGEAPRLPSRRGRLIRGDASQTALPFVPKELSPILDAIENSEAIAGRQPDPTDDAPLACSHETWQRATRMLLDHALAVWEKIKVVIRAPTISAGPDGSIDLYWTAAPYGLLINVPAAPEEPATYFGDGATNPDSNRTNGKLDPTKPTDVGILMWLAHTAEQ